jgi:hypothetical protein
MTFVCFLPYSLTFKFNSFCLSFCSHDLTYPHAYRNAQYSPETFVLRPDLSRSKIRLWESYYLRWKGLELIGYYPTLKPGALREYHLGMHQEFIQKTMSLNLISKTELPEIPPEEQNNAPKTADKKIVELKNKELQKNERRGNEDMRERERISCIFQCFQTGCVSLSGSDEDLLSSSSLSSSPLSRSHSVDSNEEPTIGHILYKTFSPSADNNTNLSKNREKLSPRIEIKRTTRTKGYFSFIPRSSQGQEPLRLTFSLTNIFTEHRRMSHSYTQLQKTYERTEVQALRPVSLKKTVICYRMLSKS